MQPSTVTGYLAQTLLINMTGVQHDDSVTVLQSVHVYVVESCTRLSSMIDKSAYTW